MNIEPSGVSEGIQGKFRQLKSLLAGYDRAAIAFSGGADSSFLLAAAAAAGMAEILAVTLVTAFFTPEEKQRARDLAKVLGVTHLCLEVDLLADGNVVRNDARRCYFCKRNGFSLIREAADQRGISVCCHGTNVDDLSQDRPGMAAARELGFISPLVEAGFSKPDIRECSQAMGLPTWSLPSQSCLATRIPQGTPITAGALEQIAAAERLLHGMGLGQVRVRCHGDLARIEVTRADMEKMPVLGPDISQGLKALGFAHVTLDLGGYAAPKKGGQI